jgi:hypothetical protein
LAQTQHRLPLRLFIRWRLAPAFLTAWFVVCGLFYRLFNSVVLPAFGFLTAWLRVPI